MTQLTLNNQQIDTVVPDLKLNDLVDSIITGDLTGTEDMVITSIKLDGVETTLEENASFLTSTIEDFKTVEFETTPKTQLILEALNSCSGYIDTINKQVATITKLFQDGNLGEANQKFAETIELIDLYIQLISNVCASFNRTQKEGDIYKVIQEQEIHLLSILKAMLPAKERNDIIALCDLLEYELTDNLTKWKINVIPQLRKIVQS